MQILILKHFLKTCIQQPKLQELHVVSLVKIFNTDKKKTSGNSWCTHAIFWTHNNSKLMMISCIKYMYHEQYFVNVLMSLDHDYAMFWCTIFLHYILLYYPIIQKTSRFKQYSMTGIKQSKYFSFEESLLVCQAVDCS